MSHATVMMSAISRTCSTVRVQSAGSVLRRSAIQTATTSRTARMGLRERRVRSAATAERRARRRTSTARSGRGEEGDDDGGEERQRRDDEALDTVGHGLVDSAGQEVGAHVPQRRQCRT